VSKGTATSEKAVADAIITRLKHIKTVGPQWYVYQNGLWRETRRDAYRPLVYAVTDESQWKVKMENGALSQVEGRMQCDGRIFRGATLLQDDGSVAINVKNGILQVTPDEIVLLDHNHEFYFTRALNVEFDAKAICPRYGATFERTLPDGEDQRLKQLSYGNFLWPDARYEVVQIDIGEAGTGKSTLAEPIIALLGSGEEGLLTSLSLGQICDHNCYALAKLRYALVNLGTELQSLAIDESENFKKIVSGEPFEARPIYCPPFTMTTFPKLWFLANSIPRFKNGTEAELRRARFTIFNQKPEVPDLGLKAYLRENERAGIFNFMLKGLQELMRGGKMPLGGRASQRLHNRFRISNDTIKAFVDDYCVVGKEESCPKEHIANAYTEYCDNVSLPFKGDNHFFQKLYDRFPQITESRKRIDGNRVQSVVGIGLKPSVQADLTSGPITQPLL
jgi:P4 family phage/plasmid primase-like protien